jgi:acyl-CoA thioester hydrolase
MVAPLDHSTSKISFRVRFCETDLMGIVHHANYLAYFELGRVEWLRARGVTYAQWAQEGVHLPVVDVSLRYRNAARFDDELTLFTTLGELKRHSLRFDYRLMLRDALLTEGHTRLASVSETTVQGAKLHRIAPISDEMLARLRAAEV